MSEAYPSGGGAIRSEGGHAVALRAADWLRHTYVSHAIEGGVPLNVIAENCGTSVRMIEKTYAKILAEKRRDFIDCQQEPYCCSPVPPEASALDEIPLRRGAPVRHGRSALHCGGTGTAVGTGNQGSVPHREAPLCPSTSGH